MSGAAEFVAMEPGGTMRSLARNDTLPERFNLIVPGEFGGQGGFTDLLFYRQGFAFPETPGFGQFYATGPQGAMQLLAEYDTFSPHWTQVVPGNFGGDGLTDLFYYSAGTGRAWFWATKAQGQMDPIGPEFMHGPGWTQIVPGKWGGPGDFTDLFFYSRTTGYGVFAAVGEGGRLETIRSPASPGGGGLYPLGIGWTHIVPGHFGGPADYTDLFFYAGGKGDGVFTVLKADAELEVLRYYNTFARDWTHIVPGNFGGPEDLTDLLFYAGGTPRGSFWAMRQRGDMEEIRSYNSFPADWAQIVSGEYGGNGLTDLLFYRTPPIRIAAVSPDLGPVPADGPVPPPTPAPNPLRVAMFEVKATPQTGDFSFNQPPLPGLAGTTITGVRNRTVDITDNDKAVEVSHLGRPFTRIPANGTSTGFNGLAVTGAWSGRFAAGELFFGTDEELRIRLDVSWA